MSDTATAPKPKTGLPPRPKKAHWFFGNAWHLLKDPVSFLQESTAQFNGIFRVTSRILNLVVLTDPEYVKHVMQDNNKNYTKWFKNDVLELLLGRGLLTSEGDFWRKQRRLAQPAFHKERLARMADTMVRCTQQQIEKMERLADKQNVDISTQMMELTLNIVAGAMFSSEVKGAIDVVSHEIERTSVMATARFNNPLRCACKKLLKRVAVLPMNRYTAPFSHKSTNFIGGDWSATFRQLRHERVHTDDQNIATIIFAL